MTVAELLTLAQQGVQLAQTLPSADPRITLGLSLAAAGLQVAQTVASSGHFGAGAVIEVDTLGMLLVKNIHQQLLELDDMGGMSPA